MTTRIQRRHEKLLGDYREVSRELGEAQDNGASRNAIERLNVRERSLVASIRRVRIAAAAHRDVPDIRNRRTLDTTKENNP